MIVHLIDGTYELFRQFYGQQARHATPSNRPYDAARGVVDECLRMLEDGATHIGVATDHVIESFRNDLWEGYKTGEGIDPALRAQFEPLEEALARARRRGVAARGVRGRRRARRGGRRRRGRPASRQVVIWTVDKDLGQCVGGKVVQHDRKSGRMLDADAIREKFGVPPESIADYLALVGDSADGFPGSARLGCEVGGRGAAPLRHDRGDPRRRGRVGRRRRARRAEARGHARRRRATSPRTSRCSRRCAPTCPSAPSTTGNGAAPPPIFDGWCGRALRQAPHIAETCAANAARGRDARSDAHDPRRTHRTRDRRRPRHRPGHCARARGRRCRRRGQLPA